jgi:hypothetical protein
MPKTLHLIPPCADSAALHDRRWVLAGEAPVTDDLSAEALP